MMVPIEKYVQLASKYITRDHLENFLKARIVLSERQLQFCKLARSADKPDGPFEVGYGGARGGGKSFGALSQLLADDCQRSVVKALSLRRTGASGREQFEEMRWKILRHIPHKYSRHLGTINFPSGSLVVLGHFQKDSDVDKYLGLQYDVVLVEEATQLTEEKARDVRSCVRTSKTNWRPRVYYVTNPGNVGHNWFVKRVFASTSPKSAFIGSRIKDNTLLDSEYEERLSEDLTGWKRDAWLNADFNIKAGSFFNVPYSTFDVAPDDIEYYWGALDHGVTHWGVFYLLGRSHEKIYLLDEVGYKDKLAPDFASAIARDLLLQHKLIPQDLRALYCGHDCFSKEPITGGTIADEYFKKGFNTQRAKIDRVQGANLLRRSLSTGRVLISTRCVGLLNTLPLLQRDPKNPNDVKKWNASNSDYNKETGDDWYDGARYGVASAPPNIKPIPIISSDSKPFNYYSTIR